MGMDKITNEQIQYVLQTPSCEEGHEVKYLQHEDAWYCVTCRGFIGYTKDFFKDYDLGHEE